MILDTDPELALLGRRCVPARLLDEHRFEFSYPRIEEALRDLRARSQPRVTMARLAKRSQG